MQGLGIESRRTSCIARANTTGFIYSWYESLTNLCMEYQIKIISSFDPALMWLGTIHSTLIVLTDAMTEPLVISAYQC